MLSVSFGEESLYGFLARMTERRVSHVVSEAGSTNDCANLFKQSVLQFRMFQLQTLAYIVSQRLPETRHFQAMCESIMYKDAARKRENLRLIL